MKIIFKRIILGRNELSPWIICEYINASLLVQLLFVMQMKEDNNFVKIQNIQQNKQELMKHLASEQFMLLRFEPPQILFLNKINRQVYLYSSNQGEVQFREEITHPILIRSIPYKAGYLSQKGSTSMATELENRRRAHQTNYFSEEQLINTFLPLFECLKHLHEFEVTHKVIHPSNIIISFEDEGIKLKDWMCEQTDSSNQDYYYGKQLTSIQKSDDLLALGLILIESSSLKKIHQILKITQFCDIFDELIDKYSQGFVLVCIIVVLQLKKCTHLIIPLLKKERESLSNKELNEIYGTLKQEKQRKCTELLISNVMQTPPIKKFAINSAHKKVIHYENSQNQKETFIKKNQKVIKVINKNANLQLTPREGEEKQSDKEVKKQAFKMNKIPIHQIENNQRKFTRNQVIAPTRSSRKQSKRKQ